MYVIRCRKIVMTAVAKILIKIYEEMEMFNEGKLLQKGQQGDF